jgi:hypothetical protein
MKVSHKRARMTTGISMHQTRARAHTHINTHTRTHNYASRSVHTYTSIRMCFSHLRQYSTAHMFTNSCKPVRSKNLKFVASQAKTKSDQRDKKKLSNHN